MDNINWLAVIAATVSAFVIGGVWYSPLLFDTPWRRANNFTDQDMKRGSPPVIFGVAFLFTLVIAINLAFFLGDPAITLPLALAYSFAAGFGFATMGLGVVALFERRPLSYFLINGGYLTLKFLVMGLIIGLWR